jgi:hypothetical protein
VIIRGLVSTAAVVAALAGHVSGAGAGEGVALEVVSVLATNVPAATDARLAGYERHFVGLPYSSFRILRQETRRVAWGARARFNLPGPGELKIRPKIREASGIALNVGLTGPAQRALVDTDLCLQDHRVLMVGGPRHRGGVLIVFVAAEIPNRGRGGAGVAGESR